MKHSFQTLSYKFFNVVLSVGLLLSQFSWPKPLSLVAQVYGASTPSTVSFKIDDFSSVANLLQLSGSAQISGTRARLTTNATSQAGAAYFKNKIILDSSKAFSTYFSFEISNKTGGGADGFVFIINGSQSNIGASGGGLGYVGIDHSLGIEFDTYNNGAVDSANENHIGININGQVDSGSPKSEVLSSPQDGIVLDSSGEKFVWIDYDGSSKYLDVRIATSNVRPNDTTIHYQIDLTQVLTSPELYTGFSAGTGGSTENHDIINWIFDNEYNPLTPNSTTYTMAPTSVAVSTNESYIDNEATINATIKDSAGYVVSGVNVNFSTTSGTLSASSAITNSSGVASVVLSNPNLVSSSSATVTASLSEGAYGTLVANFYPNYSIRYNGNTSTSGNQTANSVYTSTALSIANAGTLQKTGYDFIGWNTSADGTGTYYQPGDSYTLNSQITLYAQWLKISANVNPLNFAKGSAAVSIDPDLILDGSNIKFALVSIRNYQTGDVLNFTNANGISGIYRLGRLMLYSSSYLSASAFQTALRSVTFSSTGESGNRTIDISVINNRHSYALVNYAAQTWDSAKTNAASAGRQQDGQTGYLATITSESEDVIISLLSATPPNQAWFGAQSTWITVGTTPSHIWKWVTGPENGTQFWQGDYLSGYAVNSMYARWATGEPNSGSRNGAYWYEINGWGNSGGDSSTLDYYIIEYGNNSASFSTTSRTINVSNLSVTYQSTGHTSGTVPTDTTAYTLGQIVTVKTQNTLAKTGYSFGGWSDGSSTYAANSTFSISANKTLSALWTANSQTLSYNANGGTGSAISNVSVLSDASVTLATNSFSKAGYTASGWQNSDASVTYTNGQTISMPTSNLTLYARFVPNTYTLTYNLDGGTNSLSNPATYTPATTTFSLGSPSKEGFTFVRWEDGSNQTVTQIPQGTYGNITLTAVYTRNSYTVSFNSNSGTAVTSQSIPYQGLVSSVTDPTRNGYDFVGWYKESSLTTVFDFSTDQILSATTLYAKWSAKSYSIYFEENGGTSVTDLYQPYTSAVNAPTAPTKSGYSFGGWYSDSGLTTAYTFTTMPLTDPTLYAKWIVNSYTLSFDENGGSSVTDITQNYLSNVTQPTSPTKSGYLFRNWYSDSGLTQIYTFNTMPSQNTTLYAGWNLASITNTQTSRTATSVNVNLNGLLSTSTHLKYVATSIGSPTPTDSEFINGQYANGESFVLVGNVITSGTSHSISLSNLPRHFIYNLYALQIDDSNQIVNRSSSMVIFASTVRGVYTFENSLNDITSQTSALSPVYHNATTHLITSTARSDNPYTAGVVGSGYYYDGLTVLNMPDNIIADNSTNNGFTFVMYFKTNDTLTPNGAGLLGYQANAYPNTNNTFIPIINIGTDKKLHAYLWVGSDLKVSSANSVTDDQWHKIVLSASSTELNVYLDDVKLLPPPGSTNIGNLQHYGMLKNQLGTGYYASRFSPSSAYYSGWWIPFKGYMDDIYVFDEALTQSQLLSVGQSMVSTYSVSYNLNGGTNDNSAISQFSEDMLPYTLPTPTKTGYTFNGWYENSAFTGSAVSTIPLNTSTNKIYYAKWTINHYSVNFISDLSTVSAQTVNYGASPTLPSVTKNGYYFVGWYENVNDLRNVDASQSVTQNKTYTARWVQIQNETTYPISLRNNIGEIHSYYVTTNTNGSVWGSGTYTDDSSLGNAAVHAGYLSSGESGYVFIRILAGQSSYSSTTQNGITTLSYGSWGGSYEFVGSMTTLSMSYNDNGSTSGSVPTDSTHYQNGNSVTVSTNTYNLAKTGYTFLGWNTQSNGSGTSYSEGDSFTISSNLTLYAQWTINSYTMSFDSNGGTSVSSKTQDYNTSVTEPTQPTKSGYSFAGWFSNVGLTTAYTFTTMPALDSTLYAKWTPNTYTISFEENGGSTVSDVSTTYGSSISAPSEPTKTGYTFEGWYSNIGLTSAYTFSTMPLTNPTLYAKWSVNQYTVSFNENGGSMVSDITQDYGTSLSAPSQPLRSGYSFGGWYSDSNLSSAYTFSTIPAHDVSLYAKWTINTYTISFASNGGSSVSSISQNFNTVVTEPTHPTRTGYSFEGWFSDVNFTNEYTFTTMPAGSFSLYAKWSQNSYALNFVTNGGSIIASLAKVYNALLSAPIPPTKTGYSFEGWYSDSSLSTSYTFTSMPDHAVTVYAKWSINTYTLSFESNGGSSVSDVSQDYGTVLTEPQVPTRASYLFGGWYSDALLSIPYTFTTMPVSNTTLYAKWTLNAYTLSFEENGGSSIPNLFQAVGSVLTAPTKPERVGYVFRGWYRDENLSVPYTFTTMPSQNLTLYAKWDLDTYSISYEYAGGTGSNPSSYTILDSVSFGSATREGYQFLGWLLNGQTISGLPKGSTGSLSLQASWLFIPMEAQLGSISLGQLGTDSVEIVGSILSLGNPKLSRFGYELTDLSTQSIVTGSLDSSLKTTLRGLNPYTTYSLRLYGSSGTKTVYSESVQFTPRLPDSDEDGIPDARDAFPQDPTKSFSSTDINPDKTAERAFIGEKASPQATQYDLKITEQDLMGLNRSDNILVIMGTVQFVIPVAMVDTILAKTGNDESYLTLKVEPQVGNAVSETTLSSEDMNVLAAYDYSLFQVYPDGSETPIHQLGGKIKVGIGLDQLQGEYDPTKMEVYFYNSDTGAVESMKAVYDPATQSMVFMTEHFSYYILGVKKEDDPALTTLKVLGLGIALGMALMSLIFYVVMNVRKKKDVNPV